MPPISRHSAVSSDRATLQPVTANVGGNAVQRADSNHHQTANVITGGSQLEKSDGQQPATFFLVSFFMPGGNTHSTSAEWANRPTSLALPIFKVGGHELRVTYTVFGAAAAILILALVSSTSQGNSDLVRVVFLGSIFWASGWLVQAVTYLGTARLLGTTVAELFIGVLGIEVGPRKWPASQAAIVALATITSLILLGAIYRLVEGDFQLPSIVRSERPFWTTPSIGLTENDSIWSAAAWLCWAQAIFQLYPLPRTLGRQLVGSLVFLSSSKFELETQSRLFRQCLSAIALLVVFVAISAMLAGREVLGVQSIFLVALTALGLILFASSRSIEIGLMLAGYRSAERKSLGRGAEGMNSLGIRESWKRFQNSRRERRQQKSLRTAQKRERGEAIDAQRVDEILTRLHQHGPESLNSADQAILKRVSENLRREREQGNLIDLPPE